MSTVPSASLPVAPPAHPLTLSLVGLLAAGAGLSVAALYYSQPMLGELQADLGAGRKARSFVAFGGTYDDASKTLTAGTMATVLH